MIVAAALLILHTVSGTVVEVNPGAITHLRNPEGQSNFPPKAQCMVNLADGKFVTVTETCEAVRRAIEEARK